MSDIIGVKWFDEVTSTNALMAAEKGSICEGQVYAARYQSAGRGQRGNSWESSRGKNLTFSIFLQPETIFLRDQFCISQIAALSVVDYLESRGVAAKIKWPNDIYVGDKKICGILIENSARGNMVGDSIVGIGLNMNQTEFVSGAANPVSLTLLTGEKYDIEKELGDLLAHFFNLYHSVTRNNHFLYRRNSEDARYLELLYRRGEWMEFEEMPSSDIPAEKRSGRRFSARILGIDNSARLILEGRDGNINYFCFKEIKYIIQ